MNSRTSRTLPTGLLRQWLVAIACAALVVPGDFTVLAQGAEPSPAGTTEPAAEKLPPDQLDSLVAPIALYPDPLLAQTLVAATYPLEMIQLQQWLKKNPGLKDKALTEAVAKQPWDPSVQSMAALPDVVKRLADDVQWTTDLGNAFLAQQADVMDAVQRMRKKAVDKGTLTPNENQKVETQVVGEKTVIVVESANPEVVYVPSYSPTVVYGPPVYPYYPYPPIYYPPYPPGAAFVSFSFGVMVGAAWGGYCCGMGWGGSDIDINVDNDFNRINAGRGDGNRGDGNRGDRGRGNGGGSNKWQHNPQHRGAAPYADRATAGKYGGTARGESPGSRQASARQQPAAGGGRTASPGVSDRSAGGSRAGGTAPGSMDRSGGRTGGSGSDRIGGYDIPKSSPSRASGFDGGSRGYSGGSARASSARGASSMGGRGGGGRRR
ncbi:MAG: DUF3300 domain-containing protein [Chromatiales bacterium]|nr:DUF3300 domain-containing protein [Chromatiales bacterium]